MDEIYIADEETIDAPAPKRLRFAGIEYNSTTYDSMVLREPTVGDLIAMRKKTDPVDQMVTLIQAVSGLPAPVVNKLPQRVMEAASAVFEGFSKPTPPAGTT